jgi:hypothetical protein
MVKFAIVTHLSGYRLALFKQKDVKTPRQKGAF